jgi:hypothetical protein
MKAGYSSFIVPQSPCLPLARPLQSSIMQLRITVLTGTQLEAAQRMALFRLLERAYEEDLAH